jgi:hypothetical protein
MKGINYKKKCLSINGNLRAVKVKGCELFSIIIGEFGKGHKAYSSHQDTKKLAWEECYYLLLNE